jgi:hypothetical protein
MHEVQVVDELEQVKQLVSHVSQEWVTLLPYVPL